MASEPLDRYSRQIRFPQLGEAGQRALLKSRVTLCGCGALGTVLANHLARAGVGSIRIIDRDFIETHNLQRQILFDEDDVAQNLPKAEAAARKIRAINSTITVVSTASFDPSTCGDPRCSNGPPRFNRPYRASPAAAIETVIVRA